MPILADAGAQPELPRIDLARANEFRLGRLHVIPARREVHLDDTHRELEPQFMKVLVALAVERPAVMSRDRLVELCWDGRIVGDDTLNRCIVALRHLAKEFDPTPFEIQTIRGVGYCLVETVTGQTAAKQPPERSRKKWGVGGILAAILLGTAGLAAHSYLNSADQEPVSIAVLPFRNLSGDEPYFAEGIGEEILGQLGRDEQFRVAGRGSSRQFGPEPDIQFVARKLNVDYVLEGSVRQQADRVRINAALVRAGDNTQLWTDTYDGNLKDIFEIQQRIGAAIARSLQRKLAVAPVNRSLQTADARAYSLYLTGKALLRTRNLRVGSTATGVLRDAINIDPGYAPAWASLATALELEGALAGHEGLIAKRALAQQHARRAIQLAPALPEAHRSLGEASAYGSAEFFAHLRKAVQLDGSDAENLIWLGVVEGAQGNFAAELAAYRRASTIDPIWFRTTGQLAIALAERGERREAEAVARQGMASDAMNRHILLGRIAWILGDASEAVRHWSIVAAANSPRWSSTAQRNIDDVLYGLGLHDQQGPQVPRAQDMRHRGRVWLDTAPDRATWLARNRNVIAADIYRAENCVAAKLMIGEGRIDELIRTYDAPVGLLSLRPLQPVRPDQLREAPVVALALQRVGRDDEARQLLRSAEGAITAIDKRGTTPLWFDAEAAAVLAMNGRSDAALRRLERAASRGWVHADACDLQELGAEPAFATLRRQRRFLQIREHLRVHLLKERQETQALST